jgi:hypothetical protein
MRRGTRREREHGGMAPWGVCEYRCVPLYALARLQIRYSDSEAWWFLTSTQFRPSSSKRVNDVLESVARDLLRGCIKEGRNMLRGDRINADS